MLMITYEQIKNNENIRTYISKADQALATMGYTDHSFGHVTKVADMAGYILETLGQDAHTVELVKIAGYLHDIGNLVNRVDTCQNMLNSHLLTEQFKRMLSIYL